MSASQMNPYVIPENVKRPGTVVVVAILVFIVGLLNLAAAVGALYLAIEPGESQVLLGASTSDWVWYLNSALSFLLFLIYIWLGMGQLKGSAQSWTIVNLLMIINIFFAFFQLFYGTGFVTIFFCLLVLILNNARGAKAYFMSNLPPEIKAQIMAAQEQAAAANAAAAAVAAQQAAAANQAATQQAAPPAPPAPPAS